MNFIELTSVAGTPTLINKSEIRSAHQSNASLCAILTGTGTIYVRESYEEIKAMLIPPSPPIPPKMQEAQSTDSQRRIKE